MMPTTDCRILAMPDSPLFPLDLSGYRDAPPEEVATLLEKAADTAEERAFPVLTALLMNRLLRLLRQGSRQEILAEAMMLNRFLAVEAGSRLRQHRPETYGAWTALGELLSGAARSTSRAAVPALLRSTQGHGLAILELLAAEGRALPRAEVRRRLDLGEAHLSHLLRDLEEADLIVRYRPKGSKEVFMELGPAGREVVAQSILPPWLERFADVLLKTTSGSAPAAEVLSRELVEAGAPSRLAADWLAGIVARMAPAYPEPSPSKERSNVLTFVRSVTDTKEAGTFRFQGMLDRQGERLARGLFTRAATG
jgi:DNA-binding MarR family transcriptional regulator